MRCYSFKRLYLVLIHVTVNTLLQERQRLVDQFQEGLIDVLICSYGVGATGLTLTRSHIVVLLDRPWTPGDVLQVHQRSNELVVSDSYEKSLVCVTDWLVGVLGR